MPSGTDALRHRATLIGVVVLIAQLQVQAGDLQFRRHVINPDTDYSAAAVVDVDRDGQLDIVCGGDWYQAPDWERHFVRHVPKIRGRPDGFAHLALDVNRDGWTDIVTVNYRSSSIKWVQHPGGDFGPWTTHIAVEPGPMETGRLVDVDGDGRVDLLPNGARFAAWWELEWSTDRGTSVPRWIRHDLPQEAAGHGLGLGDVDGDGRADIVCQSGWLKAPEDRRLGRWYWNPEYRLERASIPMVVADVDEDGDRDIIWTSAHGYGVYWLEQTSDELQQRTWQRHAIDTEWSQAHAPLWVDLDGDGRHEFVAGKRYMSHGGNDPGAFDPLVVYRYQYDPATRSWQRWTISAGERVGLGLDPKAVDIDGDGDVDLVASGRSGLYLLENCGSGSFSKPPPRKYDEGDLLIEYTAGGERSEIDIPEAWGRRRAHVVASIIAALGSWPTSQDRVPLDVAYEAESSLEFGKRRNVTYQVDAGRRVSAEVQLPHEGSSGTAGVVCAFRDEAINREVANQLTRRGFVTVSPVFSVASSHDTGLRDSLWQVVRTVDLLQSIPEVHGERLALVGDALDGNLLTAAALDPRVVATFTVAATNGSLLPVEELVAAVCPRAIYLEHNRTSTDRYRDVLTRVRPVFALQRATEKLEFGVPGSEARSESVAKWLESQMRGRK